MKTKFKVGDSVKLTINEIFKGKIKKVQKGEDLGMYAKVVYVVEVINGPTMYVGESHLRAA